MNPDTHWYVYMVQCSDGSIYTGIARNLDKRIKEHNTGPNGAKYTRTRRPVQLVYYEQVATRSIACKREYEIKQMTKIDKKALIGECENQLKF